MTGGLGANVRIDSPLRASSVLFGETTGRVIVSFPAESEGRISAAAADLAVPFGVVGTVGGTRLRISLGERSLVDEDVAALSRLWTSAFERSIESAEVL